jgi:hypothetical protein
MPDADETDVAVPQAAFALLGHRLRLEILLALFTDWRAAYTEPRGYAELMRAVGERDSGKFNYHLRKLTGPYVRKTDGGYVPTASATALYRAVLATRPTAQPTRTTLDPEADCPACGGSLAGRYEDGFVSVTCPACASSQAAFSYPFPQNGLDGRTDAEVFAALDRRVRAEVGLARSGQCPDCAGEMAVTVTPEAFDATDEAPVELTCETCTWQVSVDPLTPLLSETRVASALFEIGIPVETSKAWELPTPTVTDTSEESSALRLEVTHDGMTARIDVDRDLQVVDVSVTDASGAEAAETDGR